MIDDRSVARFTKVKSSYAPSFISNTWCRTTLTLSSPSTAAASVDTRTILRYTTHSRSFTLRKGAFCSQTTLGNCIHNVITLTTQ